MAKTSVKPGAKSATKSKSSVKSSKSEKQSSAEQSEIVEVNAEDGGHVEPPPPEFRDVPMIEKPYTVDRVTPALEAALAG